MHSVAFILLTLLVSVLFVCGFALADENPDELKEKINQQQAELSQLDEEIAKYQRELTAVSREKNTLQSSVRRLDISRNSVKTRVVKTVRQIRSTEKEISDISTEILEKEAQININTEALASALRSVHERDSDTFIEIFLRGKTVSDVWSDVETLRRFQTVVHVRVGELAAYKSGLEEVVDKSKEERNRLGKYQEDLEVQKRSLDINRIAKNNLLKTTKNKESNYQALLAKKRTARKEFEQQLRAYESKLRYIEDPNALPTTGESVLRWPLKRVHITQYFGNTKFAKSGAYSGKGHNGVDFGIALGTPVYAAQSGTITATGNTDAYPGCLSYGKWVLIKHSNGISTFYGHLSKRLVSPGQAVQMGDVIAHSGSTGYSTGPHLHFGTYASSGVRVVKIGDIRNTRNCKQARIPIAPWKAYLNPMDYL